VPVFILQPLVENAVRHGIARRVENGIIEIVALPEGTWLVLRIIDNGPGYEPTTETGLGLANTRLRLLTLFGEQAELQLLPAPDGGTIATLRLPLR